MSRIWVQIILIGSNYRGQKKEKIGEIIESPEKTHEKHTRGNMGWEKAVNQNKGES